MRRALLVNQVRYGGIVLPPTVEAVLTVRRASGATDWEASVTVPGVVVVPDNGEFTARMHAGEVAGNAAATVSVATGDDGPQTTITWRGEGAISLPDD